MKNNITTRKKYVKPSVHSRARRINENRHEALYESIMNKIAPVVKKALSESYNDVVDSDNLDVMDIYEIIEANGGSIDTSDDNIRWAYWDDNDTEHEEDDAYIDTVTSVETGLDMNNVRCVYVTINDMKKFNIENAPYEDSDDFIEYVLNELDLSYGK